jgi:hypothetical protein
MNYEQNGTGEPLVLIPYLGADHACYANNVIHALSSTVSGTRRASASRRVRAKLEDARTSLARLQMTCERSRLSKLSSTQKKTSEVGTTRRNHHASPRNCLIRLERLPRNG